MNGCGDDRGELAGCRAVGCAIEEVEDVAGVRGVEATRDAGRREGVVLDEEGAGLVAHGGPVGGLGSVVGAQLEVYAETLSSLGEQAPVGEADELAGELAACDGEAKLRADAGRFARGERYAGKGCTQSLYST
jgi:hypothetical protein